jgi:hypothetical protein
MGLPVAGTTSRRCFARGMIAALIGGLTVTPPRLANMAASENFGTLLRHRASAARIGRRYLATLPAGTDNSRLLAMSPTLDKALRAAWHEPEVARRQLRQGISDDFSRGDTVVVDGWVLAATEARFCAVIALA